MAEPIVVSLGDDAPSEFPTIVVDPPWRYGNAATRGAAEDHYKTLGLDELAGLQLPAAPNAHLYLWTTNAFLEPAFGLMRAWGFEYKTTLTWGKPQIGLGNYFRNNTEHVLFGIRGSLPTRQNDTGTLLLASRRAHSAKPEAFYDLVVASSPEPRVEVFSRQRRLGWYSWGDEA